MQYGVVLWCSLMVGLSTLSLMYYQEEYSSCTHFLVQEQANQLVIGSIYGYLYNSVLLDAAVRQALEYDGEYRCTLQHPREQALVYTCLIEKKNKKLIFSIKNAHGISFEKVVQRA